jgi:hypothetical protein
VKTAQDDADIHLVWDHAPTTKPKGPQLCDVGLGLQANTDDPSKPTSRDVIAQKICWQLTWLFTHEQRVLKAF